MDYDDKLDGTPIDTSAQVLEKNIKKYNIVSGRSDLM
jgi:hypothetical protein